MCILYLHTETVVQHSFYLWTNSSPLTLISPSFVTYMMTIMKEEKKKGNHLGSPPCVSLSCVNYIHQYLRNSTGHENNDCGNPDHTTLVLLYCLLSGLNLFKQEKKEEEVMFCPLDPFLLGIKHEILTLTFQYDLPSSIFGH